MRGAGGDADAIMNELKASLAQYSAANAAPFRALRKKMEEEWTPQMTATLGIDVASLPIIWDADFLYGPRTPSGDDSYLLCEINVSSVFRIPDQAPAAIAQLTLERLLARDANRLEARAVELTGGAHRSQD